MLPPCVDVVDHHLHHAVFGPFLFIISLQDESACAHAEYGDIAVEQFLETERFVEGFAGIKVLCRNKGACRFRTAWNHHSGRPSCSGHLQITARWPCQDYDPSSTSAMGQNENPFLFGVCRLPLRTEVPTA